MALLLVLFKVYRLEQPAFFLLACIVFSGFAISYWLPFRFKETFLILLSLAGAYALLSPLVASLLIAIGFGLFGIVRSGIAFRWRVLAILVLLAICLYYRATSHIQLLNGFWPVLGAMFMFRMIVYLYDVKHMTTPPAFKDYLSYFFLLPNYYFLLFPSRRSSNFQKRLLQERHSHGCATGCLVDLPRHYPSASLSVNLSVAVEIPRLPLSQ